MLAGRTFRRGRFEPVEIGIDDDGFITSVGRDLRAPERHDVGDRLVLPASTDLHVHFREPVDREGPEDWASGTRQAALGGVGLVGEMPNSSPPVDSVERLRARRDRGAGRIAVDMLLYAAANDVRRVGELSRECGAFKLYLAPTTGIADAIAPEALPALLAAVRRTGLPLSVHAESPEKFRDPSRAADTLGWNSSRPIEAELAAVRSVLSAAPPGLRLNIAHVTSVEVAEILRLAGQAFEAAPHHLLLSASHARGSWFKVNPPLRAEPVRAALEGAFARGEVPFVASDHAPHAREAKERPFPLAPSGVPGVATLLPLLLAAAREGGVELGGLLRAACDRPARWFGVPMGRIAPDHRADLIVIDPRERRPVRAEELGGPCGWTPFEGREAIFPREHYHDGELIVEGGEYVGRPRGRFVRPEFAPLGPAAR